MSTGHITLAYLGEMGVVFNLAYIELEKTRYTQHIQNYIEDTKKKFIVIDGHERGYVDSQISRLRQLDDMLSSSRIKRKDAWIRFKNVDGEEGQPDSEHYDKTAGFIFDLYDKEFDKVIAQIMLVISGLSILAVTLLNQIEPANVHNSCIWWIFFALLSLTNVVPVIFVLLGRKMRKIAIKCVGSIEELLTNTYTKEIEVLNSPNQ